MTRLRRLLVPAVIFLAIVIPGLALFDDNIPGSSTHDPSAAHASCSSKTDIPDEAVAKVLKDGSHAGQGLVSYRVVSTLIYTETTATTKHTWTSLADGTRDIAANTKAGTYHDFYGRDFDFLENASGATSYREPGTSEWHTVEEVFPVEASTHDDGNGDHRWACHLTSGVLVEDNDNNTSHLKFVRKALDSHLTDITIDLYFDRTTGLPISRTNLWQERGTLEGIAFTSESRQECLFSDFKTRP